MKNGNGHPPEVRAAATAALLSGQSISAVAKEYDVPRSTIARWRRSPVPVSDTQKREIGDLLLEYLEENLITLKAQAKAFGDPDWLKLQGAQELAILHGVMTDKAVRLIEAMSKHADINPPS